MICPACHTLNVPGVAFCRRCGGPLGFISTIGPLETAYAEGFAYRQAVQGRQKGPTLPVQAGIQLQAASGAADPELERMVRGGGFHHAGGLHATDETLGVDEQRPRRVL